MSTPAETETVVMLPFMGQGHIIPYLALAIQIQEQTGSTIIFVNTPLNINKLKSTFPSQNNIRFVALPFCSTDHGLPPDSENTDVVPVPLGHLLVLSTQSLEPAFRLLIADIIKEQGQPPLCVIADMFFGWMVDIAREFGFFHAMFNGGGAYGTAIFFSLWLNLPQNETDADEITLPDFPEVPRIHRSQIPHQFDKADGTSSWSIFFRTQVSLCFQADAVLFNTVEELDETGLRYFRRKLSGRPVWAIRPTVSSLTEKVRSSKEHGVSVDLCIEWLNTHPPNSVLYVSFGSETDISAFQTMELAMALEASNKSFIWVIKPPFGVDRRGEFRRADWLPEGFEARMKEQKRGLLVPKWAPQLEILSHKSTGAFLSHCGWNSVLESLGQGVPIIAWPLASDQFFNAKLLEEEIGVCVEVARGNECEVRKEHIVAVLDLVMGNTQRAKEMKRRACEVKQMIEGAVKKEKDSKGSSAEALGRFFKAALSKRRTKTRSNGRV